MPNRNPTAAGTTDQIASPRGGWEGVTISIDGISSDHTDAATITPDANPSNVF